jgi:hypothetical protein
VDYPLPSVYYRMQHMSDERFKNIASGIQSLILAFAVVVGGGWTLYRFRSLDEVGKARAEVEQLQRGLRERGILKIEMASEPLSKTATGELLLSVNVTVENTGNRTEVLRWDRSGLRATQVLIEDGRSRFGARVIGRYAVAGADTPTSSILPGQSRVFPILLMLPPNGVYQLVFEAAVSPQEAEIQSHEHAAAASGVQPEELVWRASKYYVAK